MTTDLVVLTVLPEEYRAVLACLRDPVLLRGTHEHPNTYAWQMGTLPSGVHRAPYSVAVGKGTQTTSYGALAARQAIHLFAPHYIVFVGVGGGFDRDGQQHGDVAVSSVVVSYDYGKVDTGGYSARADFTYRCDEGLVRNADALIATDAAWWPGADGAQRRPRARIGLIASGDKLIDDPDDAFFASVRKQWPKILAVEMEGAGVGAAVQDAQTEHKPVGFLLVRGISDMPHAKLAGEGASTAERDHWKQTASHNAARFLAHLVARAWPVPPRVDAGAAIARAAAGTESAAGAASVSGSAARPPASPRPAYPSAEIQALSEQLQDAQARKQTLRDAGIATDVVDREILQLRRQLREGGRLRAGDALSDGRYLLIRPLGRGGFAVVWEAYDHRHHRRVAVKVLHQHLAGDVQRRERFFRGARVMMTLNHPAVVRVHEPRGEDDAFCYFVMDLVPGGTLRDAVLDHRIDVEHRLRVILEVGEALAEAHRKQLVHRDVKPANILIDADGNAKLADFDLVGAHDTTGGTRTGALGTVVYAAPECLDRPHEATARADVFGLGMTAVFCLSGQELSMATFRDPAAAVARLDCAMPVRRALERAVAWDADRRFVDAAAMVDALRRALDGSTPSATTDPGSAVLAPPLIAAPASPLDPGELAGLPAPDGAAVGAAVSASSTVADEPVRAPTTFDGAGAAVSRRTVARRVVLSVVAVAVIASAAGVARVALRRESPASAELSERPDAAPPSSDGSLSIDTRVAKVSEAREDNRAPDGDAGDREGSAATNTRVELSPSCDETDCLLDGNRGPCCAKYRTPPGLPAALDEAMIDTGLALVAALIRNCRGGRDYASGRVKVSAEVAPDGHVLGVTVISAPSTALGACVAGVVQKARFAETRAGGSFLKPYDFF